MIFNLLDNAIKYSYCNGNIFINLNIHEENAYLNIKDQGIGLDKNEFKHIFERFYRVDKSHSKTTGGSGLGLSIVKHIAAIHGYSIDVYSDGENQGSTFIVKIPLL